jgi:hypothetical protein
MVERRKELNQRYGRKKKMAKDGRERETLLKKIHRISPWWEEPKPARA